MRKIIKIIFNKELIVMVDVQKKQVKSFFVEMADLNEEFEQIESEIEDSRSGGQLNYEISTYPADFTIEVLCSKWEKGDIIIPDFQRKFVWDISRASKLIDSFMLGLPIPSVFLYIDKKTSKNLVIDGQQRLKSIFLFCGSQSKEELTEQEKIMLNFRLKDLPENRPWYNKTFSDFTEEQQSIFNDCVLRATIVKQIDPNDNTSIYHIFERLNTGGVKLEDQEVRNCVYAGPFNQSLLLMNKHPKWRKIFTRSSEDIRQSDVELILRFFALRDNINNYEKPLKDFLSSYFGKEEIRYMKEDKIKKYEELFKKTVDSIVDNLGDKPFHVRGPLNKAAFDSVMIAFSNNIGKTIPNNIKERYKLLCEDENYIHFTTKGTTDPNVVKDRIKKAEIILFG
jgi:uncharacterized protein with ParB-like and HNH nuclease domain